ncbi:unnamed protein product [Prunus armeniaca]|uniref:Uncharacterized protein n=1 Tax=Prunus armeniaca TaxID=36596 RepID=A0A6J5TWU3_PRUAR|nr:unnamed protein product [Prunus armeniaca]
MEGEFGSFIKSANPPKAHLSPSLLVHIPSSRNPTHHCSSPRLGPSGFRSQTAFQRALPLHLSAKLLGQKMEPRGHQYPTPVRIRTHPQFLHVRHWPQVGFTTRCLCKLPCLRAYARAHLLLHGSCEAHVGGHVVLRFARVLFDVGDRFEEGIEGQLSVAEADLCGFDRWICGSYLLLAIFSPVSSMSG